MNVVRSIDDIGKVRHTMLTLELAGVNEAGETESITYMVRGVTPIEARKHTAIVSSVQPPSPPRKTRTKLPTNGGDKLQISDLVQEDYDDYEDPTYKEEVKAYLVEQNVMVQRASMYRMMVAVEGFDVSDETIKERLETEPHPKEPLESLLLRLDQLSEIILPTFDQRHLIAIITKINELSGVDAEQVNFT